MLTLPGLCGGVFAVICVALTTTTEVAAVVRACPGVDGRTRVLADVMPTAEARRKFPRAPYRTPVNVFPAENGYLFALTYGPDTDWVRNVLAAGGCELQTRGRTVRLVSPRLFHDEQRRGIRPLERQVLRVLNVTDFLSLTSAPG